MTFRLDGRIALVTGSTRGIGWAIARELASAGAHVVVNGRAVELVTARVAELEAEGWSASGAAFDVVDVDAARVAVDGIAQAAGRLDILVNNAGVQRRAPLAQFEQSDFDEVLAANLRAPFALAQAAARHMVTAGWGRIVNIGSTMGQIARPGIVAYVTSKTGIVGLTRALAVELAPLGVTVNAVGPGYVATEMNAALLADTEFTAMVERRTPAARWGRPEEIAAVVRFLASEEASYVTGQTVLADGGLSMAL
jgi:gluconate 5-dehydrogenase